MNRFLRSFGLALVAVSPIVAAFTLPILIAQLAAPGNVFASLVGVSVGIAWVTVVIAAFCAIAKPTDAKPKAPDIPEGCDVYLPLTGMTAPRWVPVDANACARELQPNAGVTVGDEHGNRATAIVLTRLETPTSGYLLRILTTEHVAADETAQTVQEA